MKAFNRFFLAAVLLPQRFYSRMGVNVFHLRSILTTKLIIDDRRPNTFQQTQQKKKGKEVSSATGGTIVISAVLGAFFLYAFAVGSDYVTHLTVYFSMYIFMLASTLISDFTSVLMDVRDNFIILPKPVNDKTVVVARLLHILIHISKLVIPMTLPGLIYLWININAWGALVLFLLVILVTMFTVFLINAVYIFILRVTTPQKFQSVISYFQIFFAVFIYGTYMLVPRLIDSASMEGFDLSVGKWIWLAPPYWFAGAWQLLAAFDLHTPWIAATIISLSVPVLSVWAVVKYFAPSFNQKLSQIAGSNPETTQIDKAQPTRATTSAYVATLAKVFTKKGSEQMAFLFCWKMTSRSKDYKLKVYPAFGYMLVYLVIIFLKSGSLSLDSFKEETPDAKRLVISILYFSSFMVLMALIQIAYSEKFKAAWIYFIAPVKAPGELITGALKSAMLKYYIPVIVLIAVPAVLLVGIKILPNLVLGLSNAVFICSLIARLYLKHLPFSADQSIANKSGGFIRGISMLFWPAIIAVGHYFIYNFTWAVSLVAVLSMSAAWYVIGSIKNTTWQQVKVSYED